MPPTRSSVLRRGALVAALLLPAATLAHHGWSGYDGATLLKVAGTIRQAGYEHPHGYVRLEAAGKTWVVVLAPPSRMENRGLASAALKAGVAAQVEGYASRSDAVEMRAERITIDGKTVELR